MGGIRSAVRNTLSGLLSRNGVILSGAGRGLRFDPTGGNIRYVLGPIIPYEENALVRYLEPGGVFYDIGANIGFYAIVAAKVVGKSGKVVAFEPFAEAVEAIRRNARLNKMENIITEECAVAESSGWMNLEISSHSETNRLTAAGNGTSDGNVKKVRTVSLDDYVFVENGPPPTVVMVDVEGAEFEVLRGMRRVLKEHRPIVLCENHWLVDQMNEYCAKELPELGYSVERMDGGSLPTEPIWYHFILKPKEIGA
jgi:FkbM family methyltransferase